MTVGADTDSTLPPGADWWVGNEAESFGPYTPEQMRGFVAEARIVAETPVRRTDEPEWQSASRHPIFASLFAEVTRDSPVRPEQTREEAPDLTGAAGGASAEAVGPIGISQHDLDERTLPAGETTTMAHIVYALYVLNLFTVGIAGLIGVIIAALKRRDVRGSWLETHYLWQIRTFWLFLLAWLIAGILFRFAIGAVLPFLLMLWALWRVIKGWVRLGSRRPIDDPSTWF